MKSAESTILVETYEENGLVTFPIHQPPRQCVLDASKSGAWDIVGGLSLIVRMLRHLDTLGIEEVIVVTGTDRTLDDLLPWRGGFKLSETKISGEMTIASFLLSLPDLDQPFLFMDATHLLDPRLIEALGKRKGTYTSVCRQ